MNDEVYAIKLMPFSNSIRHLIFLFADFSTAVSFALYYFPFNLRIFLFNFFIQIAIIISGYVR